MGTFGTVAIIVFAFVFMFFESIGKHLLCLIDLHPDFRKIGKLQRRAILINQGFKIKSVKMKIAVFHFKIFLGKIESLLHQVGVAYYSCTR